VKSLARGLVAVLSAMTVDLIGGEDAYHVRRAKLGRGGISHESVVCT
jgi:hypothetical protein